MRAAYYNESGPAKDVIKFGEFDKPKPGRGEILVKLDTSGVNPSDVKSRTVGFERIRNFLPLIPHTDGAGIVESIGKDVKTIAPGDRVWVAFAQWRGSNGTCAEYVSVPQSYVFSLPSNTSFVEGACAGVPVLTAMHALSIGPSIKHKTVLITGGATSVGNYAIQIAKQAGARVLTTVGSEAKAATAKSVGADETILYKSENIVDQVNQMTDNIGVHYLVDMDMSYYSRLYPLIVAERGFIVVYGSNNPIADGVPTHGFFIRDLTLKGFLLWNVSERQVKELGENASRLFSESRLKHNVGATYPFDETAEAQDVVEYGRVSGNVVIELN